MPLALFDLDDTIISGDCAVLWNERMAELGWVGDLNYLKRCEAMNRAYHAGTLSIERYMELTLAPLAGRSVAEVQAAVSDFIGDMISPLVRPDAIRTIAMHRMAGDHPVVISASAAHLVEPIARGLGIQDVLCISVAARDGSYTGTPQGILTFREGKVKRLMQWMKEAGATLDGAAFYSDSQNDLPLLQHVDRPYAVNPDATLRDHAQRAGWPILHWALSDERELVSRGAGEHCQSNQIDAFLPASSPVGPAQ